MRRGLLALAAAAVVLAALDTSGAVDVDHVEVNGNRRADDQSVREAAAIPDSTTILRVRTRAVARRVEELPLIASATVRRRGLDRVSIDVVERAPVMQVEGGTTRVLVDREGHVLLAGSDDAFPVVELDVGPPGPGGHVTDLPALENAHAVWAGLSGPLRAGTRRYVAPSVDGLILVLDRGVEVHFGRAERIDEKVRALGAVLDDLGDTPVESIDVRAPETPVIRTP